MCSLQSTILYMFSGRRSTGLDCRMDRQQATRQYGTSLGLVVSSSSLESLSHSSIISLLRRRHKSLLEISLIDRSGTAFINLFRKAFFHKTIWKIPLPDYVDRKGSTSQIISMTTNHAESRFDLLRHRRTQVLVPSVWRAPSHVPYLSKSPLHQSLGAQSYPARSSQIRLAIVSLPSPSNLSTTPLSIPQQCSPLDTSPRRPTSSTTLPPSPPSPPAHPLHPPPPRTPLTHSLTLLSSTTHALIL